MLPFLLDRLLSHTECENGRLKILRRNTFPSNIFSLVLFCVDNWWRIIIKLPIKWYAILPPSVEFTRNLSLIFPSPATKANLSRFINWHMKHLFIQNGIHSERKKKLKTQTRIHCSVWNGILCAVYIRRLHKNGFECWWNSSKKSYLNTECDQMISIPARTNRHKPQMGFQRSYLMTTNSFHFNKLSVGRVVLNILNDIGPIWNIMQFTLLIHFTLAKKNLACDTLYFDPLIFYAAIHCVSVSLFLANCVCMKRMCVCLYAWSCSIRVHLPFDGRLEGKCDRTE